MSVTICALTDADRADADDWVARAESELATFAVAAPQRVVDTSSAVLLHASFKPAQNAVSAALTLYRDHGRVRVALNGSDQDVGSIENWLVQSLELSIAARL